VKILTGDENATFAFYNSDNCGIIVVVTYIGIDEQAIIGVNKLIVCNFDIEAIEYRVGSIIERIKKEIIPIDTQIIITTADEFLAEKTGKYIITSDGKYIVLS